MSDAYARLLIYFENPVAIGEHPQITEEMDKLLEQHASASDKLESLNSMFTGLGEGKIVAALAKNK
jgi:hypothetical protein